MEEHYEICINYLLTPSNLQWLVPPLLTSPVMTTGSIISMHIWNTDSSQVCHATIARTSPIIMALSAATSTSFTASWKNAFSGFPIIVALTPVAYSRLVTNAPVSTAAQFYSVVSHSGICNDSMYHVIRARAVIKINNKCKFNNTLKNSQWQSIDIRVLVPITTDMMTMNKQQKIV